MIKKTPAKGLARRKMRVRAKVEGTATRPRIAIARSNKFIYAQAIDDTARVTLASSSSLVLTKVDKTKYKKVDSAKQVGADLGKKLLEKKVTTAVYDRAGYAYKGRVAAVATGLREAGVTI